MLLFAWRFQSSTHTKEDSFNSGEEKRIGFAAGKGSRDHTPSAPVNTEGSELSQAAVPPLPRPVMLGTMRPHCLNETASDFQELLVCTGALERLKELRGHPPETSRPRSLVVHGKGAAQTPPFQLLGARSPSQAFRNPLEGMSPEGCSF